MAAVIAILVGYFSKNIIATIFAGLIFLLVFNICCINIYEKIFIFIFCIFAFSANADEKKTTFTKELFDKAQSDGKVVVVSSWVKYCSSCASQMKVLNKAKE